MELLPILVLVILALGVYAFNRSRKGSESNDSVPQPYDPFPPKQPVEQPRKAPAKKASTKKKTTKKKTTKKKSSGKKSGGRKPKMTIAD